MHIYRNYAYQAGCCRIYLCKFPFGFIGNMISREGIKVFIRTVKWTRIKIKIRFPLQNILWEMKISNFSSFRLTYRLKYDWHMSLYSGFQVNVIEFNSSLFGKSSNVRCYSIWLCWLTSHAQFSPGLRNVCLNLSVTFYKLYHSPKCICRE